MSDSRIRKVVKNTFLLYVRMFFMTIISLYTSRVVLSALGIVDFGLYNVVGGIVIMFSFLNSSMSLSVNRFLAYEIGRKDFIQLQKVFSSSILIHIFISIGFLIVAETLGLWFLNSKLNIPSDRMDAANWVYQFSVFTFIISILRVPYNAIIIANENMGVFAYFSIIEVILKLILVYILFLTDFDKLKLYSVLMFIASVIVAFIYFIYTIKQYKECKYVHYYDKKLFKSLLNYAGLSTFGNMAYVVVNQGQNLLLNVFFGPVVNAARGVSFQIHGAISGFITNIYTAINPQIVKSYAANENEHILKLIFQGTKLSIYLLLLIILPLVLEIEIILNIWLTVVPEFTIIFTRLILINTLLFNLTTPSIIAIQATGKVAAIHLTTGSLNLLNLVLAYIFLKNSYQPEIVFYIQILISCLINVVVIYIQKLQLNIPIIKFCKEVFVPIFFVVISSSIIVTFIWSQFEYGMIRFIITLLSSVVIVISSSCYLGMNRELRDKIFHYLLVRFRFKNQ
jgi:O-antigen/teichoic acid export membrane protein